jgi:hypothetical protein
MMTPRLVPLVKLVLAGLSALLLLLMVMGIPGQFAHLAEEEPDLAYLRWPLTVFFELELLCVLVVIGCTWRLLTMLSAERLFSESSLRWVDVILAAMGTAWTAFLGMTLYFMTKADEPGTPILLIVLLGVGAAVCLLVLVLRAVLQQATSLRTEMEAVI